MGRVRLYICVISLYMAAAGTHGDGAATETVRFGVYVPPIVRWALDTGAPGAEATLSIRAGADTGPREASHVFRLMMNVDVLIRAAVTPYRNREDARDEDLICETQSVVISGGVFAASAPEIT